MKIVYFTESLLPLVDGVSLTLARLFETVESRGIDFRVYSPFVPGDSVSWSSRVRPLRYFRFPLHRDYRVSLPVGRRVARELDDFAPDLIHIASPTPLAAWAQAHGRRRGIPVVATFHTDFVAYFRYYGGRPLERVGWRWLVWFYRRCVATYAPAPNTAAELQRRGVPGVEIWSRGVDTRRFAPHHRDEALRSRLGAGPTVPLLLMVSRLVKEKDLADLAGMDRILRARGTPYRLALVGDGPMRAELERQMPQAHFAGKRTGDDLARWYASADIFVFPSTTETFGNVVLEALASGLPAVVVDRGGPQHVIEPGRSGLVARANDPAHLADTVERLIRDPALRRRMGEHGRAQAEKRSWEAVNQQLIASYERVIARAAGTSSLQRTT